MTEREIWQTIRKDSNNLRNQNHAAAALAVALEESDRLESRILSHQLGFTGE